ncbi:MAG: ATP-binding protein [Comamonas sp.]|uniref:hybrid sensor histidine kinase/response regulator n=1 Tax=Comamonas sp. TaxID=34028 RepID=UPI002FCB6F7E
MSKRQRATERDFEVITRFYEVASFCARQTTDRPECLKRLLEAASELVDAHAAALYVFSPPSEDPEFMAFNLAAPAAALLKTPQAAHWAQEVVASLHDTHFLAHGLDGAAPQGGEQAAALPWLGLSRQAGWQTVVALPLRNRAGVLLGMLAMFYPCEQPPGEVEFRLLKLLAHQMGDYLERHAIQQAVAQSEERFRSFLGATSDVVYRMGPDWAEMRHLKGQEFLRDTEAPTDRWLDLYIPREDQAVVSLAVRDAVQRKGVFELEHRVIRVDGRLGWTHSRAVPVLDDNGEVIEWFGAASDISSRKCAEQALRVSQQRYHTLFDSIDEGYCVIRMEFDADGNGRDYTFLEVNQAFERHTGISDAVGRSMLSIAPEHERWWFEVYGHIAKTGESRRFELPAEALQRHYDVYAFRIGAPEDCQVAVLFNDVSQRKRQEAQLREVDRRKDEFLAILAHELRNPLAPVRSGLQVLQLSQGDPQTAAHLVPLLQRQVDHMVRLVDDLLEVSRIAGGKVELRPEAVNVSDALRSALETSRPQLDAGQHHFSLDLPDEVLTVHADPVRLSQIIANLLNNAAKYTDQCGRIALRARRDGSDVLIVVEDNGRGIAQDMLPRIFDLFAQSPQTSNLAQGGIGVGLTLVRSLVEMQGGQVDARSEGPGLGSVFTVRLPLHATPAAAAPDPAPDASYATEATDGMERKRVLVVDDNVDAAEGLRMLLELMGMDARAAYDGADGLVATAEFAPHLVFLDIGMPGMDGFEFARRVRAENTPCPTLVAVSGWGQQDDRRRSREAGIDAHLVKPVGMDELQEVLLRLQ